MIAHPAGQQIRNTRDVGPAEGDPAEEPDAVLRHDAGRLERHEQRQPGNEGREVADVCQDQHDDEPRVDAGHIG